MLCAENISVHFGERKVIRELSFSLPRGRIVALVGRNGAGKTTLIRCLNGSISPNNGRVTLEGRDLSELSRREVARRIAVVAQENETKFPVTVTEYVLAGRFANGSAFGWESESDIACARNALEECDLGDTAARLMNELSGGERQRVVLARALATDADIFLLDEPTANLDLANQARMFGLVRQRCIIGGSGVVITHDPNLAASFADDVLMLDGGKVFAFGPPDDVFTEANLKHVFDVDVMLDRNPSNGKVRVTTIY